MIIILKTYSENNEKTPLQEFTNTVSNVAEPISESVKEYLPEMHDSRFRKVVNQYWNWWKRSRIQNENKKP